MNLPPVERTRIIFSPKTLQEISAALFRSSYFKGSNQEINENHITMTVASTLKSFGEIIAIALIAEQNDGYKYEISSRPLLSTTVIDYGKSEDNLSEIQRILESQI